MSGGGGKAGGGARIKDASTFGSICGFLGSGMTIFCGCAEYDGMQSGSRLGCSYNVASVSDGDGGTCSGLK